MNIWHGEIEPVLLAGGESKEELALWLSVVGNYTQTEIGKILNVGQRRVSRMIQRVIKHCRATGEVPEWVTDRVEQHNARFT